MLYREAQIIDLPEIVAIYNTTISSKIVTADIEPVSIASKTDWFYQHHSTRPLWVIEDEFQKKIAGWFSFQNFYGRPAYNGTVEFSLYISPEYQSQGLGKSSIQYMIEKCPSLHIHTLLGFIFEKNTNMLALCKKMGFEEWGHLRDVAYLDQQFISLKIVGLKIKMD